MSWAVLCDFDHTITDEDVTDRLLEAYALPEWRQIEALWEQGALGSRACMEQQIALLRASEAQVNAVADSIHIDPDFKSFFTFCEKKRIPMIVVSDGLDYVIERVLARHGIRQMSVFASHMEYIGDERWQLTSPYSQSGCASNASTCKCAIARQMRSVVGVNDLLYVGDGRSDYCVSLEEADFIVAKSSLLTYCQQHQLAHAPFDTFAQASHILGQLIQRNDPLPASHEETLYA